MDKFIPPNISSRTKKIMELVKEFENSDEEIDSDDSWVPDEDELLDSDHDSESEIDLGDADEDEEESVPSTLRDETEHDRTYYGKRNCMEWSSNPKSVVTQATSCNIIKVRINKLEGPALMLGQSPTPQEVWNLLFTEEMITQIVEHTNVKLEKMRSKIKNKSSPTYKITDRDEIHALLGILLLCSIFKSSRESLRSLFSTGISGRPIMRTIMTEKRCFVLTRALRFDDASTREIRVKTDPAAAVSNLFSQFIGNCQNVYSMGAHGCVDETLVPFRGRVKFLTYMPKKPAKYGIKLLCLTDAHNSYLYNAYIYCGKGTDGSILTAEEKKLKIPTQSVVRLTKCIFGTNRNITCDNWFTSLELVEELWRNKLTLVGTLRINKPQIPSEFLPNKTRKIGTSLYGFTNECTLVSYVPKKSKAVILMSSMHHTQFTDSSNNKPEIISFYNATKSGVDTLDMKCSNYSANRKTRRWPLAILYYMLAMCSSNAYTLYNIFQSTKKMSRYDFVLNLGISLAKPYMKKRLLIPNLPEDLRKSIVEALQETETRRETEASKETVIKSDKLAKRKSCRYCPYQKKRATQYKCIECETPTCLECSKKICNQCVAQM